MKRWFPFSLPYTHTLLEIYSHVFSYHCHADYTQLLSSFNPSTPHTSAQISACLNDTSSWIPVCHTGDATPKPTWSSLLEMRSSLPQQKARNLNILFHFHLPLTISFELACTFVITTSYFPHDWCLLDICLLVTQDWTTVTCSFLWRPQEHSSTYSLEYTKILTFLWLLHWI